MSISIEEFQSLQTQFIAAKQANYEIQEREQLLKKELEKVKGDLKKSTEIVVKSKKSSEFANLQKERDQLAQSLKQKTEESQAQIDAFKDNLKNLLQQNQELQEENKSLQQKISELQHSNLVNGNTVGGLVQEQIQKIDESRQREEEALNGLFSSIQTKVSAVITNSSTVESILSIVKTCIQENPIASKTHSSSQAFESQLRQLQTQFQAQEESFKNELDRLQKLTQTQTRELERSKATVQVKEQEYIKLASDVSRYREELQIVQQDREQIILKLNEKDLEIDILKDQLSGHQEKKSSSENFEKEREQFKEAMKQKADQMQKLINERDEQRNKVNELNEKVQQLKKFEEECEKQKKQIHSLEKKESQLQKEISSLQNQLNTSKEQILATQEQVGKNHEANAILVAKIEKYEKELIDAQQSYKDERARTEKIILQLSEKAEEIQKLNDIHAISMKENNLSMRAQKEKVSSLETQVAELSSNLSQEQASRTKFETLAEENGKELQILKEESEKFKSELISVKEELEQKSKLLEESLKQVEELKTAIEDQKVEFDLSRKKEQRLIKELRDELTKEKKLRESSSQLPTVLSSERNSQTLSTESLPITPSPKPIQRVIPTSNNNTLQVPSTKHGLTEHSRSSSSSSLATADLPSGEVLQEEMNQLIQMLTTLQMEKEHLELKVRELTDSVDHLKQDVAQKELVIHKHILETKVEGRSTPEMENERIKKAKKLNGNFLKVLGNRKIESITLEGYQKMETILQETILKNIQLQSDVQALGEEINRLLEENKKLKQE